MPHRRVPVFPLLLLFVCTAVLCAPVATARCTSGDPACPATRPGNYPRVTQGEADDWANVRECGWLQECGCNQRETDGCLCTCAPTPGLICFIVFCGVVGIAAIITAIVCYIVRSNRQLLARRPPSDAPAVMVSPARAPETELVVVARAPAANLFSVPALSAAELEEKENALHASSQAPDAASTAAVVSPAQPAPSTPAASAWRPSDVSARSSGAYAAGARVATAPRVVHSPPQPTVAALGAGKAPPVLIHSSSPPTFATIQPTDGEGYRDEDDAPPAYSAVIHADAEGPVGHAAASAAASSLYALTPQLSSPSAAFPFCSQCGAQANEDAPRFCRRCGRSM